MRVLPQRSYKGTPGADPSHFYIPAEALEVQQKQNVSVKSPAEGCSPRLLPVNPPVGILLLLAQDLGQLDS